MTDERCTHVYKSLLLGEFLFLLSPEQFAKIALPAVQVGLKIIEDSNTRPPAPEGLKDWKFHEASWGPFRVVVLPRSDAAAQLIFDSNTGVVIQAPPDAPIKKGDLITNDGAPPNADRQAIEFIMHGTNPPPFPAKPETIQ